jgi:hypothetical protein
MKHNLKLAAQRFLVAVVSLLFFILAYFSARHGSSAGLEIAISLIIVGLFHWAYWPKIKKEEE